MVVKCNPLRQVEPPRRRNKGDKQSAAAFFNFSFLCDGVRRGSDRRFGFHGIGHRDGRNILALRRNIIDMSPGRQHVIDHMGRSREPDQPRTDHYCFVT